MGTVNEHLAVLMTQLTELINILLETFDADGASRSDADIAAQGLECYRNQVEDIATTAQDGGFFGLFNVCMLYHESLAQLVGHGEALSDQISVLLEEWPVLVMTYIESPADVEAITALVDHLQNPAWTAPLSSEDAAFVEELLAPQETITLAQDGTIDATPVIEEHDAPEGALWDAPGLEAVEPVTSDVDPEPEPVASGDELAEVATFSVPEMTDVVPANLDTEPDILGPASAPVDDDENVGGSDATLLGDQEDFVSGDFVEPEEEDIVADVLESMDGGELDETSRELIDLLALEVTQIAESLQDVLANTADADWQEALADVGEELERLGEGAESVGLVGLQQVSERLRANLQSMIIQDNSPSDDQCQVLSGWPSPVLDYLHGLHTPEAREALAHYLRDSRWPQPMSQAEGTALIEALVVVRLDLGEDEQEPRQRHAQLEDISLAPPEDVNPELLDSLLQELPRQAADFSASIQRLTSGEGTLADVDAAQRIAHTLKGAANTVGVPGVANLTHHLEDILLALTKHSTLPVSALTETLINAADCLEVMSETLIGMSEPRPEKETLGVLQEVMDWANLVDREGVPSDNTCPQVRETLPGLANWTEPIVEQAQQQAVVPTASGVGTGTRVSADLVDELLRLTGEGMILNGQLQDRLERTAQQMRSVRTQNSILQQLVLELEHLVTIRGVSSPLLQRSVQGEFDPLEMEQYNELHTVSQRLLEGVADAREMAQDMDAGLLTLDGLLTDQHKVQRESEGTIMRTRMVPVKTIAPRLQRGVRQACRLTGKEAELVLGGGETLMDSHILSSMIDPLMHMLRNAVDHGLERPEERELIDKPRAGVIALDFVREGNNIVVRCRDDGAGLNIADIRHTALERGLIRENQTLSEDELSRLILHPGFSTRSQTTQVSGRGIGMDAVYNRVQELKGSLTLTSETNKGCLIELRLPVSLMSTQGLLVRADKQVFAVSDRGVEQILYPGAGELSQVGDKTMYQLDDEVFEATSINALLSLAPDHRETERRLLPALLVREESGKGRIVFVQEVLDSLPLVVKNLGRYIPAIRGVVGATILGDGSATPVLDLPELMRSPARAYVGMATREDGTPTADNSARVALVVDDSLSARRALADFVKDLGFEVRTAGDGLEAVAILDRTVPDILLVDMEMPRMNGLELAAHVRSREATAHVPIIMITSRSGDKHRQSAARAGVDGYLIKPFAENELAAQIQQLTALRGVA